jgi:ABC-2 type transport system ATP-binding protein
MNAIKIRKLTKVYSSGTRALKGVDLEIKEGDFFALLGANGAGKTTIIGILTGVVNKTKGKAEVFGADIDKNFSKAKGYIGVVPQEFNFNIFEKVIDIVITQAGYFGIPRWKALEDAEQILKNLQLWDQRDLPSRALSGGMKRRLMIARALIHHPKLLILDEPTAGVDVNLRHSMWDYLKELNEKGTTILLTTHYIEEAEKLCRNVAIIKEGTIVKEGSVKSMTSSLDRQTFILNVDRAKKSMKGYDVKKIDDSTISVNLRSKQSLTNFIMDLKKADVHVKDIKPSGNRLEEFYLSILKK